jgi:hypothetical protein
VIVGSVVIGIGAYFLGGRAEAHGRG